jgi:hypothetical protein
MNSAMTEEALKWLENLVDELSAHPYYAKSGEEVLVRVAAEIRLLAPHLRTAALQALVKWLESGDEYKFYAALSLIELLNAEELVPQIQQLVKRAQAGQIHLPRVWLESVEKTLQRLSEAPCREVV